MPTVAAPTPDQVQSLVTWLHRIPLHRRDPTMNGDFSDGVLVAEVIHHYSNNLVSVPDIQRLENNLQLGWDKRLNWLELDPVFIALNIRILEQCLKGIILNLPGYIEQLLVVLRAQLDRFVLQMPLLQQPLPLAQEPSSMIHTLPTSGPSSPSRNLGDTPVLRLSNVDYHTQKAHVVAFFNPWGGPSDPSKVHVPISLETGKMIYEVYVVFESSESAAIALQSVFASSVATIGGPPQLLNRRIDLSLVSHDELHVAFFGRTHRHIDETSEFLTEANKEKMLKLCRSYKNWFNSHTPARPFEFVISFIELLPWQNPAFAKEQRNRAFELLRLSILTLVSHQGTRGGFPPDLVVRMISVARLFTEQQQTSLTNCLKSGQQDSQQRRKYRTAMPTMAGLRRKLLNDDPLTISGMAYNDPPPISHHGRSQSLQLQQHQQLQKSFNGMQQYPMMGMSHQAPQSSLLQRHLSASHNGLSLGGPGAAITNIIPNMTSQANVESRSPMQRNFHVQSPPIPVASTSLSGLSRSRSYAYTPSAYSMSTSAPPSQVYPNTHFNRLIILNEGAPSASHAAYNELHTSSSASMSSKSTSPSTTPIHSLSNWGMPEKMNDGTTESDHRPLQDLQEIFKRTSNYDDTDAIYRRAYGGSQRGATSSLTNELRNWNIPESSSTYNMQHNPNDVFDGLDCYSFETESSPTDAGLSTMSTGSTGLSGFGMKWGAPNNNLTTQRSYMQQASKPQTSSHPQHPRQPIRPQNQRGCPSTQTFSSNPSSRSSSPSSMYATPSRHLGGQNHSSSSTSSSSVTDQQEQPRSQQNLTMSSSPFASKYSLSREGQTDNLNDLGSSLAMLSLSSVSSLDVSPANQRTSVWPDLNIYGPC